MKDTFFNWEEFSGEQRLYFPEEAFEEIFLVDLSDKHVWLSKKLARMIFSRRVKLRPSFCLQNLGIFFGRRYR